MQKALEKLMMTPQQSASVQDFFQQTAQGAQPAAASFLQQVAGRPLPHSANN